MPAFPDLTRHGFTVLQVNLGYKCNQTCTHCHVNAGPKRTEMMSWDTTQLVLQTLETFKIQTLDLTGGAPELNPWFRSLVLSSRKLGVRVIDRCNLTILQEPHQEDLAAFLAENEVEITASLPCYSLKNVDKQRGNGVFERSIQGLKTLNSLGYGIKETLRLNLVYNPGGPFLPPDQGQLQNDYRHILRTDYGIEFHSLFTLANMPISRFRSQLERQGQLEAYMEKLVTAHREENLASVMCLDLLSVDWQGYVYDCDFNQLLEMNLPKDPESNWHLKDLLHQRQWPQAIRTASHCYGCTAGQGSSCGGALT